MRSKWAGLEGLTYSIEDLGRPAVFLLPSHKLRQQAGEATIEDDLHAFLLEKFGAFTTTTVPYFGIWRSSGSRVFQDECRLYEVSFPGKKRIPVLLKKLVEIADAIGEECIYLKAGQYTCLVYPKRKQSGKGGR